ncbi:hypothetical protein F5141DRAFT_1069013 [Pisolithus sp. B1]|nr:hypothetical protein F5141DRAFT_1069013 [Pisolithus sp. B1]
MNTDMAGLAQQITNLQQELADIQQENQQLVTGLQQQQAAIATIKAQRAQRIEVMADPGSWDGNKAQFTKWWVKKSMGNAECEHPPHSPRQGHCSVVMNEWPNGRSGTWPTWNKLKTDVKSYFAPQSELNAPDAYAAILLEQATNPSIV